MTSSLLQEEEKAPSNLAVLERYVLTLEIFDCIKGVNPGYNGEIQLTEALKLLLESQKIYVKKIEGNRYDIRDQLSYVKAILDFSLGRENLKNEIGRYLRFKYE